MRKTILFMSGALALAGCGGTPKSATVANQGGQAGPAAPAATVADDIAAITAVVGAAANAEWPQRVTFLGWTADHRVAYRELICAVDELGGRGDWCDLQVCTMGAPDGAPITEPTCESAAAFELYDPSVFVAADATAAAEAAQAKLGTLTAGTNLAPTDSGVTLSAQTLYYQGAGQPRRVVLEAYTSDSGDPMGVASFAIATATASPDGRCVAALGVARRLGEYEGDRGEIPGGFAAVACKP